MEAAFLQQKILITLVFAVTDAGKPASPAIMTTHSL